MLHEPVTAITDFILGIEALVLVALLIMGGVSFPSMPYWIATMILLGIAAILGGFAHGLAFRPLFTPIYASLAALMVTLIIATLVDGFGAETAGRLRWPVVGVAILFVMVAWRFPTYIQFYAIFEGIIMSGILAVYIWLAMTHALGGAGYIAAGVGTTLFAAVLFLLNAEFTLFWTFNRNDVYHLVQMIGVVFFYLGLSLRGGAGQG
jgi:hypothetical protein